MQTKCAKCKTLLEIDCPPCYVAKIQGRFYCVKCFYEEKTKQRSKQNGNHPEEN